MCKINSITLFSPRLLNMTYFTDPWPLESQYNRANCCHMVKAACVPFNNAILRQIKNDIT